MLAVKKVEKSSKKAGLPRPPKPGPPLRWPGGKRRLAAGIIGLMPEHKCYVETCCGGAGVFWAKPRDMSISEILNDADGELINFYQVLHKRGKALAREVDAMPYSRRFFKRMAKAPMPTSAFARAARFWYLNRVAFGAIRANPTFGPKTTNRANVLPATILRNLDATIARLRGVLFECVDLVKLITLYDRAATVFYIDPPYYDIGSLYAVEFTEDDHVRLAECLRNVRGTWLLSYNDCDRIRGLYAGYPCKKLDHRYTIGGNSRRQASSEANEILFSNREFQVADKCADAHK